MNGRAVTGILAISESRAGHGRVGGLHQTGIAEGLIERADRVGDVVQFHGDRLGHGVQAHNRRDDGDGQDEHQFSGNDNTGFIVPECAEHD